MRKYKLTPRGRQKVAIPSRVRDKILDHLNAPENRGGCTWDEIANLVGREKAMQKLRELIKLGLVEEVSDGLL